MGVVDMWGWGCIGINEQTSIRLNGKIGSGMFWSLGSKEWYTLSSKTAPLVLLYLGSLRKVKYRKAV
jgi:hypothetical protein